MRHNRQDQMIHRSLKGFTPLETIDIQKRKKVSLTGFTLMELMLAVAILLIAIVGLLLTYISCIGLSETAKNTTVALNGAKAKIEEIRNNPFDTIATNYGPGGVPGITFHIDNWLGAANHCGAVEIVNATADGTLLEVRITVSWRERGGRIMGEDSNFNGILDTGEDNGNNQLDSPVKIVTLISRRP